MGLDRSFKLDVLIKTVAVTFPEVNPDDRSLETYLLLELISLVVDRI